MSNIPTRIIEEPKVVKCGPGPAKLQIKCNDGKTYFLSELAKLKSLTTKGLQQRLRKKGWDHPHVLVDAVLPGFKLDGECCGMGEGNEEWQELLKRGPRMLLSQLDCRPGLLEAKYL